MAIEENLLKPLLEIFARNTGDAALTEKLKKIVIFCEESGITPHEFEEISKFLSYVYNHVEEELAKVRDLIFGKSGVN